MPADPVRVLVLYSHPLMGEGLERMLAAEPGIAVYAVDIAQPGALDEALAREPAVIVVEEGGAVDAAEVVRRSSCGVVLDVDITTTRAWTLRRESLSSRPDDFMAAIRAAIGPTRATTSGPASGRQAGGRGDGDPGVTPPGGRQTRHGVGAGSGNHTSPDRPIRTAAMPG